MGKQIGLIRDIFLFGGNYAHPKLSPASFESIAKMAGSPQYLERRQITRAES
jgi:hypothetical protein